MVVVLGFDVRFESVVLAHGTVGKVSLCDNHSCHIAHALLSSSNKGADLNIGHTSSSVGTVESLDESERCVSLLVIAKGALVRPRVVTIADLVGFLTLNLLGLKVEVEVVDLFPVSALLNKAGVVHADGVLKDAHELLLSQFLGRLIESEAPPDFKLRIVSPGDDRIFRLSYVVVHDDPLLGGTPSDKLIIFWE